MVIILFDTPASRRRLFPLTLTRPIGDLRFGIFTLKEFWERKTGMPVHCLSADHLCESIPVSDGYICADAAVYPDDKCVNAIRKLEAGHCLEDESGLVAFTTSSAPLFGQLPAWSGITQMVPRQIRFTHPLDLIRLNAKAIAEQVQLLPSQVPNGSWSSNNTIIGNQLFVEAGASLNACIINTMEGPVHIGKNALVMEGTTIRGPVSIGEGAVIKMGTRLYGGTTIGPFCTAGGEIKNSLLHSFSNKAHDGYLGDSYIGAWCNMGAGTSCSNVKNTASNITVWNAEGKNWMDAGLKCGTIMGDYSRTAINTSLNSGTSIGVCCSIHQVLQPDKYVPSFSWGPGEKYDLSKALEHIGNWKKLKGQNLTENEKRMLALVHNHQTD